MKSSIGCATVAAVLCSAGALHAQSGWKDLAGKPVPEIAADRWLNAKGQVSVDELKGKVWLLEFFATT